MKSNDGVSLFVNMAHPLCQFQLKTTYNKNLFRI